MSKDNNEVFYHKNGKLVHYTKKDNGSTIEQAIKDKYNKSRKKPIRLPKDEYGMVVHEINNWYHNKYQNKRIIITNIGNYTYHIINNGFNDYVIYERKPITNRKRKKK